MQLSGAIPPMVTATTDDTSEVDRETLGSFTEFLVDGGVHALFPCGSIGEFSSLSREQRSNVIETVVENSGDLPVLAGCGGTGIDDVRNLVGDAAHAGADAAVVVTPYYLNGTDEGLVNFYDRLLDDSPMPIILYDIPALTGNSLSVDVVTELATRERIIGIKDSTGDIIHHQQLIESTPKSFQVLQGMAELAVSSMDIGADGFVAGPANVYPEVASKTYEAYRRDDRKTAVKLWHDVLNPIVATTRPLSTSAGLKYLLSCRGIDVGEPLPPLSPPSRADKERLDNCHTQVESRVQTLRSRIE